jgi:hypothetical protein
MPPWPVEYIPICAFWLRMGLPGYFFHGPSGLLATA